MCKFPIKNLRSYTKDNMIPNEVLVSILSIYENANFDDLKKIPNNIVSDIDGRFWTTWDQILNIKSQVEMK